MKSMLLPLAERMVTKYVKDKRIEAEAGKIENNFFYYYSRVPPHIRNYFIYK